MTLNELDLLKAQADKMGLAYKPNIGIEALKAKITSKLEGTPDPTEPPGDSNDNTNPAPVEVKSLAQQQQEFRDTQRAEQLRLVRIRISCLNPAKAQIKGEFITVANRYIGTVRKFIPFGEATDNGYHVPYVLLQELKARKFNSVQTKKGHNGQVIVNQRLVPEFAIEELEPLTEDELNKLAAAQAAAGGVD